MTTILFVLCFGLLAIAFFLIILLYLKITQLKDVEIKQERLLKEFENVITSYVMEIKEENEVFLNRIQQVKQVPTILGEDKVKEDAPETKENRKHSMQIKEPELTTEDIEELLPSYSSQEESEQVVSVENEPEEDTFGNDENNIDTLVKDIEHLRKQGYSYEEIAKKLNKGKTEIELLHKFRQNN